MFLHHDSPVVVVVVVVVVAVVVVGGGVVVGSSSSCSAICVAGAILSQRNCVSCALHRRTALRTFSRLALVCV